MQAFPIGKLHGHSPGCSSQVRRRQSLLMPFSLRPLSQSDPSTNPANPLFKSMQNQIPRTPHCSPHHVFTATNLVYVAHSCARASTSILCPTACSPHNSSSQNLHHDVGMSVYWPMLILIDLLVKVVIWGAWRCYWAFSAERARKHMHLFCLMYARARTLYQVSTPIRHQSSS